MNLRAHRAGPLAPDDRRRAIIESVTPLLVEKGATVTTREMAEAAGIAEGTIFRVFPDKVALIHEAIRLTLDPAPMLRQLDEVYEGASIEVQIAEAARIVLEHFEKGISLVTIVRTLAITSPGHEAKMPAFIKEANTALHKALTLFFERHRDRLVVEPSRAAAAFRGLLFASAHPNIDLEARLTVDEIVAVLLHGVTKQTKESV